MTSPPRAALTLLSLTLLAPATVSAQRPRGDWLLDRARSDSAPSRIGPRLHQGPRPRREGGMEGDGGPPETIGGGVPMAGRGRMVGRPRDLDPRQLSRIRQTLELTRWIPVRISIAGDTTVTLTDPTGSQVTWRIDGRGVVQPADSGAEVEVRVRWKDDALVI